jgi:hypothetical protein
MAKQQTPPASDTYQQAILTYAAKHAELRAAGYGVYARKVDHLPGQWEYSYGKDDKFFVLRREPGQTTWVLIGEGAHPGRNTLTYSDKGEIGGDALKGQ